MLDFAATILFLVSIIVMGYLHYRQVIKNVNLLIKKLTTNLPLRS